MAQLTKRTALRAVIKAYRNNAYIVIAMPTVSNKLIARKNIKRFGTISEINHIANNRTQYVYTNLTENIRVLQTITERINQRLEPQKPEQNELTKSRRTEIEKAMVQAYQDEAQFIIAFPPVNSKEEAIQTLRFFGHPQQGKTDDGRTQYYVDDIRNQIQAIVNIGFDV